MKQLVEKLRETLEELGFAGEPPQPINEAVRREMDSARELMAGIARKSNEVSTVCRGFVDPNDPLYRGQAHTAQFHALCLEWAGHCLAYAQPGSHEYALGLRARANLHYHCGNWSDCARDVIQAQDQLRLHELADPLGTAERLSELMSRVEAKAGLKTEPNSDMNGWQPVDLADSPDQLVPRLEQSHPEHPCLSVSVAPAYDPFLGRHLVARRDIKVGEMILVEDMACCSLLEDKLHTSCAHCSAPAWRGGGGGQACPECANVLYCSEECRDEARSDYHDVECRIFAEASRRREDRESVLAALRLLVKYAKAEGLDRVIEIARVIDRDPESFNMKLPTLSEYLQPTDSSFCYTEFGKIYGLLDQHISPENEEQFRYMMTAMDIPPRQTDEFPEDEYDDLLGAVLKSLRGNRDEVIDDDTMWAVRKIFKKLKMIYEVNCHWFGSVPDEKSPTKSDWEIKCFALSYYTSLINHSCFQNSALSIGKGGKLIASLRDPSDKTKRAGWTRGGVCDRTIRGGCTWPRWKISSATAWVVSRTGRKPRTV
ncbi:uncharacterized protein LOC106659435 isoform X1 [Trichogramma pretiosum]|uniref:uncharacterized protein LOC106659435 isoform X1 n=1 Tax=Trichogramma pretiosum TaxID=7493 RepID=UPI0006C96A69|nr:uncharacterized protein LOC106659435 isoform X1 [Trichogramma pretiosum]